MLSTFESRFSSSPSSAELSPSLNLFSLDEDFPDLPALYKSPSNAFDVLDRDTTPNSFTLDPTDIGSSSESPSAIATSEDESIPSSASYPPAVTAKSSLADPETNAFVATLGRIDIKDIASVPPLSMIPPPSGDSTKSSPTNFAFTLPYDRRPTMTPDSATDNYGSHNGQFHGYSGSVLKGRDDDTADTRFQNPFSQPGHLESINAHSSVDPHYVSEGVGYQGVSYSSAPHSSFPYVGIPTAALTRPGQSLSRPQTSDGLPSYPSHLPGQVPLPSARTLIRDTTGQVMAPYSSRPYGSFDQASSRFVGLGLAAPPSADNELQFVSLAGPAPKKRSRRRYDEIERIYPCEWKGCDKAYGTLNHLNAHVAMQKHGEKRLPSQFKEMRKEWRRKKREEAAATASKEYSQAAAAAAETTGKPGYSQGADQYAAHGSWGSRQSLGGDDSVVPSMYPGAYSGSSSVGTLEPADPFGHRGSTVSSTGSPTDGRFAYSAPYSTGVSVQYDFGRAPNSYHKGQSGLSIGINQDSDYSSSAPQSANPLRVGFNPYSMSQNVQL
ncbi:hypothetical protein Q8F55_006969 [Vanrija albida]|uniref:C2H2-type domain-containing protein n=1 Tax=Vanrija albida TaxID=181172 RepID=A0ABR3PZ22_9TREE